MVLPKQLGRAIVGAGTGSGLAAKPLGGVSGSDTGVLQATNLPPITSTNPAQAISVGSTPTNVVQGVQATNGSAGGGGAGLHTLNSDTYSAIASTGNNAITVTSTGTNSTPVSLTQASAAWNVMVKL